MGSTAKRARVEVRTSAAASGAGTSARAAAVAAIAFALSTGCSSCKRDAAEPIAGRYQGGVITSADLQREANRLPPALRQQFETQNGRRELVLAMIDKRLLAAEAARRGFRDDPEIRRQVADLEERLVIQALLAAEERAGSGPTEVEERAWYDAHKAELAQPERVRVSRVLVAAPAGASESDRSHARARAEQVATRVRRGEPFAKVAAEGAGLERAHGGDLGLLARGAGADRRLEGAAFALHRVGELSPVVACDGGFAILQLTERRPGRVPSFDEARGEVKNRLAPLRSRKAFDELLSRLRQKGEARVEVAAASQ